MLKASGTSFEYIRRHVPSKKVVSWLKRGQYVPFLREICSPKKTPQKVAVI
jgi:hypothetical protein